MDAFLHWACSTPAHTYGVQPGHGRTSRSGGSPAFHASHKNDFPQIKGFQRAAAFDFRIIFSKIIKGTG